MNQVFLKNGIVVTESVPEPLLSKGSLLIKVSFSALSSGTELQSLKDSEFSIFSKIKSNPKKILVYGRSFLQLGYDVSRKTVATLKSQNVKTGYSLSGIVIGIGEDVEGFSIGDRVSAAGAGHANHAEVVSVPKNLVVKIPSEVSLLDASTATIGAIALHAVRRSSLKGGEFAVVYGVGILGLISLQILKSYGVRVCAIDINPKNLELAKKLGAEIVLNAEQDDFKKVKSWTHGYGVDSVIFAANSSVKGVLSKALSLIKSNGDLVLLGKADLSINRSDIYKKQINIITSTSYGAGRYDFEYEEDGKSYPYSYVRWTETKNLSEVLRLISTEQLIMTDIISLIKNVKDAKEAYELAKLPENRIVCIEYDADNGQILDLQEELSSNKSKSIDIIKTAVIGASPFFKQIHYGNFIKLKDQFELKTLITRDPINAKVTAAELDFHRYSTNPNLAFDDSEVDLIFIVSNQGSHFDYVLKAIRSNKHVFVEKPLVTTLDELRIIQEEIAKNKFSKTIMVGYNRRFSAHAIRIKKEISTRISPALITYNMNVGMKPLEAKMYREGGRLIGEGCHIVDLFTFLIDAEPISYSIEAIASPGILADNDNAVLTIKYDDGSVCTLNYFSIGNGNIPKEQATIYYDGKTIFLDNYESLIQFDDDKKIILDTHDKGHLSELTQLAESVKSNSQLISLNSLLSTSAITIQASNSKLI
jgi:predicted dehydrogenase/threonine dehydrogenase-like Zn-dependent dehydrogenase